MIRLLSLLLLFPSLAFAQGLCTPNAVGGPFRASGALTSGSPLTVGSSIFKAGTVTTGEAAIWVGPVGDGSKASSTIWNTGSTTVVNGPGGSLYLQSAGTTMVEITGAMLKLSNTGAALKVDWACNSTAAPGAATCNEGAGRAAIAAGADSVVITNSLITATSIVLANLQTVDTTCVSIKAVVPTTNTITITTNGGNCNAATNVGWFIASR